MKLKIDFYSKENFAIQLDCEGPKPCTDADRNMNEQFMFACFTIRQLSNLGTHPVAKVIAFLLAKLDLNATKDMVKGKYFYPEPSSLKYQLQAKGININFDLNLFEEMIISRNQNLVSFVGDGKKSYDTTFRPFALNAHGFGLFGKDVNYYVFQSIFDLYKFITKKHSDDELYLSNLCEIANNIGQLYISKGQLPGNPEQLAQAIVVKAYTS
jgi:hypothetical protein